MTWSKLIRSKFFLAALIVALGTASYFFSQELHRRYQIESEIHALQDQITAMEKDNQQLSDLTNYLRSPEYQEKEVREKLNLQKPGEHIVAITGGQPAADQPNLSAAPAPAAQEPNWKQWWNYYFAN